MDSESLPDQVILVTGGSQGIGRAIAGLLARNGARIVVAARGAEALVQAAAQINAQGGQALAVAADVTDPVQVERLVQATVDHFGRVDGLVNAAGVGTLATLPDTTLEIWQCTIEGNATSTFLCCRAVWGPMAAQGRGSILNIATSAVRDPHPAWSAYLASKAAVVALTESLAKEGYPLGIRVNALLPGATATGMRLANFPEDNPADLLSPEDVAAVAPIFFSPAAAHLFGVLLEVRKRPRGLSLAAPGTL
jgi:3-oxoacyl-[acyl-carrier protein] reductase